MMTEKLAIRKVLGVSKIKRRLAKINANRFTHTLIYNCRTARARCILKPSKIALLKTSNPILDAATALTEKFRDCRAAKSTADQKNPVQAMIVSRFLRSLNFVLSRNVCYRHAENKLMLNRNSERIPRRRSRQSVWRADLRRD